MQLTNQLCAIHYAVEAVFASKASAARALLCTVVSRINYIPSVQPFDTQLLMQSRENLAALPSIMDLRTARILHKILTCSRTDERLWS